MGDEGWVRGQWGDAEGEWKGRSVATLVLRDGVGGGGEGMVLGDEGKGRGRGKEDVEEEGGKEGDQRFRSWSHS